MWVTDSLQLLPLWIRGHIYIRLHPASDWAWEGSCAGPVRGFLSWAGLAQGLPSADQAYTSVWDSSCPILPSRSPSRTCTMMWRHSLPTPAHIPLNLHEEYSQYIFCTCNPLFVICYSEDQNWQLLTWVGGSGKYFKGSGNSKFNKRCL